MESGVLSLARRDRGHRDTLPLSPAELEQRIPAILDEIQANLLHKAKHYRDQHTVKIDTKKDFYDFFTSSSEIHGGFALAHWSEDPSIEEQIKNDLNVTIRCIPLHAPEEAGRCPFTAKPSRRRVIYAKSY